MFIKIKLLNNSGGKFNCTFSSIKPQNQLKVRDNAGITKKNFMHHSKTWLIYINLLSGLEHVGEPN